MFDVSTPDAAVYALSAAAPLILFAVWYWRYYWPHM